MTPDHSALIERLEGETVEVLAEYDDWGRPCYVSQPSELHAEAAAALRDLTEWRDIATAPRDGREIILRRCERVGAASWIEWPESMSEEAGQGWTIGCDGDGWDGDKSPTHWLPLPSAPNQAKEAGE